MLSVFKNLCPAWVPVPVGPSSAAVEVLRPWSSTTGRGCLLRWETAKPAANGGSRCFLDSPPLPLLAIPSPAVRGYRAGLGRCKAEPRLRCHSSAALIPLLQQNQKRKSIYRLVDMTACLALCGYLCVCVF